MAHARGRGGPSRGGAGRGRGRGGPRHARSLEEGGKEGGADDGDTGATLGVLCALSDDDFELDWPSGMEKATMKNKHEKETKGATGEEPMRPPWMKIRTSRGDLLPGVRGAAR